MKLSEIKLPSNRKFGFFFTIVFFLVGIYLFAKGIIDYSYIVFAISAIFFLVTLINADLLLPFNKFWMMLGVFLGKIISPIVIGIIFFGLFTPISLLMKLFRRDELRLKLKPGKTHWKICNEGNSQVDAFKHQF